MKGEGKKVRPIYYAKEDVIVDEGVAKYPLSFPKYIQSDGNLLTVRGYFDDFPKEKLADGYGYIYKGNVYQYQVHPEVGKFPIIFFANPAEKTVLTRTDMDGNLLPASNLKNNDLSLIVSTTDPNKSYDEEMETTPSISGDTVYIPEIGEKDDFLKKIVKTVFLLKKTPTRRYRKMFSQSHTFPNLFQGLTKDTKISTTAWETWVELLGIDVTIIVKDSGADKITPINDFVVYSSRNAGIDVVPKEKIEGYLKEKLKD